MLQESHVVISNRQKCATVNLRVLRNFTRRLAAIMGHLGLMRGLFDITLIDDVAIAALNREFRRQTGPTDILSFRWQVGPKAGRQDAPVSRELAAFLGDLVISIEAAQRNAAAENHSLEIELQQLILHGALHLCGYDHESDNGEMNTLELTLRRKLEIEGLQDAESSKRKVARRS